MKFVVLILLWSVQAAYAQDWTKITVYDVLQEDCRQDTADKDFGDPAGDAYFQLKDMYLPVACPACKTSQQGCRSSSTFDCDNPESSGNLVVRHVEVEVQLPYSGYSLCNVGNSSCTYECQTLDRTTPTGVGKQAVCGGGKHASHHSQSGIECIMAPAPSKYSDQKWDYWNYNTAVHMGEYVSPEGVPAGSSTSGNGTWYSLTSALKGKSWRNAKVVKAINADCQALALKKLIETRGSDCFSKCPSPTNSSSSCYVSCIYETTLGKGADSSTTLVGGMSPSDITAAWLKGFESDDTSKGGCPACPASGSCPPPSELMEELLLSDSAMARPTPRPYRK